MALYFKKTKKDIIKTDEFEEVFKIVNTCTFCEKEILSDKVRDHCLLTGNYRGPGHSECNINVTQKQTNFIPFKFHNFSKYDCHMFFTELVDLKKDKVKLDIIPQTNEEYISVTYVCIRFIDSYRFFSMSSDGLVENTNQNDFKIFKKKVPVKWLYLIKKIAYPYEYFINNDDYKKPVFNLKKEHFFIKVKNKGPSDEEIQRTKENIEIFDIKNGEELTKLYLKSDVIFLTDVFEKFIYLSIEEYGYNLLFCVSLLCCTWQCGMNYTDIKLQTLQDKDMIFLLENNIRACISSIMADRYVQSDKKKDFLCRC